MDRELDATEGDLLAAIEAVLPRTGEGLRTVEIAERVEMSKGWVRKQLHRLDEAGRLVRVRTHFVDLSGRPTTRVAYRLIDEDCSDEVDGVE